MAPVRTSGPITSLGEGRALGRLTKKGRDLQFSDDVQIGDPAVGAPYVQIHGTFPVRVFQIDSVRDEDAYTKLAEVKLTVGFGHMLLPEQSSGPDGDPARAVRPVRKPGFPLQTGR